MINQKLEQLYKKWSNQHGTFIKGGVIDEDMYSSASIRLLFLLKEVNSRESGWSLIDLINNQISENNYLDIWDTVGLWSFATSQGYKSYKGLRQAADYPFKTGIADGLKQIATTNLKKQCGGGLSNMDDIRECALRDKDFISQEIEIINPKVIICGGTYYIMEELFSLNSSECSSGAKIGSYRDRVFVDMPHPRARVSKQVLYAYFKETMLDLEKNNVI